MRWLEKLFLVKAAKERDLKYAILASNSASISSCETDAKDIYAEKESMNCSLQRASHW